MSQFHTVEQLKAEIASLTAEIESLRSALKPRVSNVSEDQVAAGWAAWDDCHDGEQADSPMRSALEASHLIFVRRALQIAENTRAARLAREGWTPPVAVDPEVGSIWKHYNGGVYEVIAIANTLDTEKYPKAVIHKGVNNGLVWTRRADDWHRSYTQQAKTSETPPAAVDPDLAETYQFLGWGDEQGAILAALKHGRDIERAEAKPGLVWVINRGLSTPDGAPILTRDEDGNFDIMRGCKFSGFGEEITHYAIITPPEEDAA